MMSIRNNKKAVGPIGAIMLFMVFLIVYFVWLAKWLSDLGTLTIQENALVGLEAFFYANLNLWVMLCMVLGMIGWTYFGGQQ